MDVSVIIPTWNRRELLQRALASVYAQTVEPGEVLVVDDGSSDDTAAMVRHRFPRAKLLGGAQNRGVSAARNLGIAAAEGRWLAFLDSDDAWREDKLERQLAALAAVPERRLCHTEEIWFRNGKRVNPRRRHQKRGGSIFRHCLPLCAISPSSVLIEKQLFAEVGTFDESMPACEDYDLWLRITAREKVLFVDEPLTIKYGGHEDQLSRRVEALDRYRIRALTKVLRSGSLTVADRRAARETLLAKIDIYTKGARRRGRLDEVAELEALRQSFAPQAAVATDVVQTDTVQADTVQTNLEVEKAP